MVHYLIKPLRTYYDEDISERRKRFISSTQYCAERSDGPENERRVKELIRMVEGRRRRGIKWYNLDDQLIGAAALGVTNHRVALDYLTKLCIYKEIDSQTDSQGRKRRVVCGYPNARGKLAKRLRFTVIFFYDGDGKPEKRIERDREVHQVFITALKTLNDASQRGSLKKDFKKRHEPCTYEPGYDCGDGPGWDTSPDISDSDSDSDGRADHDYGD
jgi:hypothetical protein